jgi:hypothetical protein
LGAHADHFSQPRIQSHPQSPLYHAFAVEVFDLRDIGAAPARSGAYLKTFLD